MRQVSFVVSVAAMLTIGMATAGAVDVYNGDDIIHELSIESGTETSFVEVAPKAVIKGLCQKCTVSVEDGETLDVEGDQMIVIEDGQLRLDDAGARRPPAREGATSQ